MKVSKVYFIYITSDLYIKRKSLYSIFIIQKHNLKRSYTT